MFSVDEEVEEKLSQTFFLFIIATLLDAFQVIMTGLMRAIGKEAYCSISFLVTYMGLGIICSYLFAFPFGLELSGIWIGAIMGIILLL